MLGMMWCVHSIFVRSFGSGKTWQEPQYVFANSAPDESAANNGLLGVRESEINSALDEFRALVHKFQPHYVAIREALLLRRKLRIGPPALHHIRNVGARVGGNGPALAAEGFARLQFQIHQ